MARRAGETRAGDVGNALQDSAVRVAAPTAVRAAIAVRHLAKDYGAGGNAIAALRDIDFSVGEGEFLSIVGPSGCGKSTLLKILAGLMPATSGEAQLNGTPIEGPRRDIGMVFQSPVLFPWRSVLDNALLPVDVQRLGREQLLERAHALIALVGLSGFEHRYPWELSGGMQQRVALVRALIHDPALLLMDEPFGALDALTREQISMDIQHLWMETRKTALHITHSIPEAVLLADRVVVMGPRPGRIVEILEIDLPRPRRLDDLPPRFHEYSTHIRSIFKSKGVLAMD